MSVSDSDYLRVCTQAIRTAKAALDRQARHHRRLTRAGHPNADKVGATLPVFNLAVMEAQDSLAILRLGATK